MIAKLICKLRGHEPVEEIPQEFLDEIDRCEVLEGEIATYDTHVRCRRCGVYLRSARGWSIGRIAQFPRVYIDKR